LYGKRTPPDPQTRDLYIVANPSHEYSILRGIKLMRDGDMFNAAWSAKFKTLLFFGMKMSKLSDLDSFSMN
jgi:hypothetical protein